MGQKIRDLGRAAAMFPRMKTTNTYRAVAQRAALLLLLSLAACRGQTAASGVGELTTPTSAGAETPIRRIAELSTKDTDWSALTGKRVLIVSHPQPHILRAAATLIRQRLLDVPDLFVLGVYHRAERESYQQSYAWLTEHAADPQVGGRIGLRRLNCPQRAEDVFSENGCSKTYEKLFRNSSGVIFTGGPDIPPALYGKKTLLTTVIRAPHRHYWEVSFLFHLLGGSRGQARRGFVARRPDYPVLGICLGMQSLNVATGGTLLQDIPSELYGLSNLESVQGQRAAQLHRNPHYFLRPGGGVTAFVMHPIRLQADSLWAQQLKWRAPSEPSRRDPIVPSGHHQAVASLGRDLKVIATSVDGKVVEALRHVKYPHVLGVQFHPEYTFVWIPDDEARLRRDGKERNHIAAALAQRPASRAFHQRLWAMFSHWLRVAAPNKIMKMARIPELSQ